MRWRDVCQVPRYQINVRRNVVQIVKENVIVLGFSCNTEEIVQQASVAFDWDLKDFMLLK